VPFLTPATKSLSGLASVTRDRGNITPVIFSV